MDIEKIKAKCSDEFIEVTEHILLRIQQRHILYREIKEAILSGEIIEEYPNDYPFPSCLIWGKIKENKILHIVVGFGDNKLWLITAYEPDILQWDDNFKIRKDK